MSDKPKRKDREIENTSPQQLREAFEEYVQRILGHDPNKLEFALMVTDHGEANGNTHVCSMIGGPPQTIAYIIILQRLPSSQGMNVEVDSDVTGSPDVEAQVKDLISKLQSGTLPSGSTH